MAGGTAAAVPSADRERVTRYRQNLYYFVLFFFLKCKENN